MRRKPLLIALLILALLLAALFVLRSLRQSGDGRSNSFEPIARWFTDPTSRPSLITERGESPCPGAPFRLPSEGLIGLLWGDPASPYTILNTHSGIDIFGDGAPGRVPIYAVYPGHLTRLPDWLSTVIIRHDDPLQPGRTIWTYYTHMASKDGSTSFVAPAFPPGTADQAVEQGELLGYQGEYAGNGAPVGLHLHFSIVQSEADGSFKNEARVANTLDPSPYFGMSMNIADLPDRPLRCPG
jgi:hypothetical protein